MTDDFSWRANNDVIARFVESKLVDKNETASLGNDEICVYVENDKYQHYITEGTVDLNPRTSLISWAFRRKIKREWLFIHQGPHELVVEFEGRWGNGESARGHVTLTTTINEKNAGNLLTLARDCAEVTRQIVSDAVSGEIRSRFGSMVGQHQSRDPAKDGELTEGLREVADRGLRNHGIDVSSARITWRMSVEEMAKDVDEVIERGGLAGVKAAGVGIQEVSGKQVEAAVAAAAVAPESELVDRVLADTIEDTSLDDIAEGAEIAKHHRDMRAEDMAQDKRMQTQKHADEMFASAEPPSEEDADGDETRGTRETRETKEKSE